MKTCKSCYNKRYFSYLKAEYISKDFFDDISGKTPFRIEFYRCTRCKSKKPIPEPIKI